MAVYSTKVGEGGRHNQAITAGHFGCCAHTHSLSPLSIPPKSLPHQGRMAGRGFAGEPLDNNMPTRARTRGCAAEEKPMQTSALPAAPPRAALPEHLETPGAVASAPVCSPTAAAGAARQRQRALRPAPAPSQPVARRLAADGAAGPPADRLWQRGVVVQRRRRGVALAGAAGVSGRIGLAGPACWRRLAGKPLWGKRHGQRAGRWPGADRARPEHYLHALRQLTCAAVPLALPGGARWRAGIVGPVATVSRTPWRWCNWRQNEIELRLLTTPRRRLAVAIARRRRARLSAGVCRRRPLAGRQ